MAKSRNKPSEAKSPTKKAKLNKRLSAAQKAHKVATKKLAALKKALTQADALCAKTSARVAALEAKAAENLAV